MKKKDGRRNNGSEPSGDTEAKYLVRTSADLMDAMKAHAAKHGLSLSVAWRQAAEWYLVESKAVSPSEEFLKHFVPKSKR